jgi:hypothetical protein
MGRVLTDFEQIRPGVTTRGDLRKLLHSDGGAFSPSMERFVHPLCVYCKIKVTFRPQTQRSDGGPLVSDDDPVVEVSKPYLETMFID